MAYLGRGIENLSDRVVLDALTASATASYTLQLNSVNFVPSSASSLTVSLNGVIQKPDSSYTVSGSTLTFSSALTSSDSIDFVIAERGITLQTPSAGSVNTDQLAATAVTTAKIANDAVTKDKVLNLMFPAFRAYRASAQNISGNTVTKVPFDTENFDTDNTYDNSTNYRFTPGVSGKYFVFNQVCCTATVSNALIFATVIMKKSGSEIARNTVDPHDSYRHNQAYPFFATVVDMNTTDYIEIFINADVNSGSPQIGDGSNQTYFGAYRIGD